MVAGSFGRATRGAQRRLSRRSRSSELDERLDVVRLMARALRRDDADRVEMLAKPDERPVGRLGVAGGELD